METSVSEWTIAIEALDYDGVKSLYKSNPQLLWTPLELSSHLESDFGPFIERLKQLEKLGTSLRPLFAFQHILLDFATENDEFAADRLTLVDFFLQNSTAEQLNTCVWGSAQNTVLHLAYFINHTNLIDQLLSKGALPKINVLGYLPSQIKEQVKLMFSRRDNKALLKSVPSADRFKQLQRFAAESSNQQAQKKIERTKSTRNYFRPGHIEERKKKVLNEEEEKKRMADRQKEVELLAQRSAVKSNPLYKIIKEDGDNDNIKQQQQQQQLQNPSLLNNSDNRRGSRVITSLKDNSYVSNSVFRQQKTHAAESDTDNVPSLEQLRAAAVTREIEGSSLSREMTSAEDIDNIAEEQDEELEENCIQEEAEILDIVSEKRSLDINYSNDDEKENVQQEKDTKSVETNDTQNNQVITEQDDTRSTISCISQSNESDTDEMDMLAHSTIKQEENIDNDDNDNDDDDTPYVPNNSNNTNSTSPTPPSFHDSDNKQNETSSEQDIPDADSLQNTPTDTLYETEEAITPIATLPKNDYFSDMTQPNPVTHNTHWEPAYLTFMEQIDDNNNKKQDLLEPDYPDYPDYPDLASCLTEEEGILEFRGLSTEITRDDKNEWYDNYKSASSDKTIRSSVSSSCKQSNSTENTNYNQQTEEEHFDYYSTKLHTDQPAEDSGEITVYLDRSSLQEERRSNTDLQTLDFRNLSNISFNNNSNLTLSSSVSSTRSSVIADLTKPRIEDISYYMSTLPVFEKAAALIDDDQENQSSQRECANREARGIPSAHEIDYGTLPSDTLNSSDSLPKESGKGKLYIGIRGAHDMLLPIPNELTYARCVISDGKYEYISRFEILGREILLDYEAVIDTLPGTIITVSIQVRPDYHVMPRTGISKFFTSARKQKEQLSGYVYAADGSISQTRFSVDAMVPKCYKKTYQSNFDCFNSWYTRTSQERARDPEEMLKIVGKLTVEMLYLPLKDETAAPKSLRECDLTLKIKQWHATCWRSGYLSIKNEQYERHFYRLIGSQLIGYDEQSQVYACYNMAKVLRLEGDATLFRLIFKDHHIDCKSETRHWFKTFKSMIGRVPLDFVV